MFDTTRHLPGFISRRGVFMLLLMLMPTASVAQIRHMRGQNVAPVFEGWQHNEDGTFTFFFGYMNRNHEEILDVPIGPNNFFSPGPEDRAQPTHFLTRRQRFVFTVIVPADQGLERRLTWTLTANGRTDTVQGWLQPEWEADDGVIQMNLGPGGTPPANARPEITGSPALRVSVANSVRVTATATDDGIPRPRASARAAPRPQGLRVRWIHYRGPGTVTFDTPTVVGEYGKPVEAATDVRFDTPGTYVLRAIAFDRLFEAWHDVPVTVTR